MDNFGFGEENIKKAYIPEKLKKEFVHKLKNYLESDHYIEKSNKFLNDEFLFKTQELLESVSKKEYNILMGDPLHPNLSFKHPLILEVKDENSALLKNNDLYGPIFIIKSFKDKENLIKDINKSHFKYSLSIYGENLEDIEKEFVCSNIFINCLPFDDFDIPKGGLGHSGFGKIMGKFGLKSFVNVKSLFVNK